MRTATAQSFYACAFTYKGEKLQAVMFGNREFMMHDCCAVLSNDVNQPWRGDEFEPAIRVLIDKLGDKAFSGDATGQRSIMQRGCRRPSQEGIADRSRVPARRCSLSFKSLGERARLGS
jgi:hypothetical protein